MPYDKNTDALREGHEDSLHRKRASTLSSKPLCMVWIGERQVRTAYLQTLKREAAWFGFDAAIVTTPQLLEVLQTIERSAVVYNRLGTRKDESQSAVVQCKQMLDARKIPYFNPSFLSKRDVSIWLHQDDQASALLPDTTSHFSEDDVKEFLKRYPLVFIKPTDGSFGEGIVRIAREAGRVVMAERRGRRVVSTTFESISALAKHVTRTRSATCVLQEGIQLRSVQGCPTDFRVHLCKDGEGQWRIAGSAAKIARRDAITTHVYSGGHVDAAEQVLRGWYGARALTMRERIDQSAITIGRALERFVSGSLGELGLDMGISADDRIVLFEANAKPGRTIFHHPSLKNQAAASRRMLLSFAASLTRPPQNRLKPKLDTSLPKNESGTPFEESTTQESASFETYGSRAR
ncbi:YheC/YheD family endospore coat-associated protein [Ferroacidibacillus organovorans]|uniref:ATP-grasp domain-containing protein n=1 Tax=Ferroacidibacillus organovorans TaxID=1765683 RepID=A0A853KBT0_9BACL|nr:YheC/YheD family protein [Ferroacidibacillus organovorans]KYP82167.1 hypothetical protein AYJ22_00495 [Ferroacidibacillus organovorans]OAG93589.1 hypothetical protein AYW79_09890 [Ferroacidibacillus organovorans]